MSEAPVRVTPEGVEAEPRRVGHRTLDLILAGSAILMSLVSLVIAVKHGMIMKELVSANSWPLLQAGTGNFDGETRRSSINIRVENAGVGPAIVKQFTIYYNGKAQRSGADLLKACCGYVAPKPSSSYAGMLTTSPVAETIMQAGESRNFLKLDRAPLSREVWDRLEKVRFKLAYDACYCSPLGECWRSNLRNVDPKKVDSCEPSDINTRG